MNKWQATAISGLLWMVGGFSLLSKGLRLFFEGALSAESSYPSYNLLLIYLTLALLVGFLKGKWVLRRTAERIFQRILDWEGPISFFQLYDKRTALILLLMMGMGLLMNRLALPPLYRGWIDLAVGAALIQSACTFFRFAVACKNPRS
ncbi:MAG: hypothetical protein AAGF04_03825 [Chlamydiota bacterium]